MGYGQFRRRIYGTHSCVHSNCQHRHFLLATTDEATQRLAAWGAVCREFRHQHTPNTQLSARCYRVAGSHYHCFLRSNRFHWLGCSPHCAPLADHRKSSFTAAVYHSQWRTDSSFLQPYLLFTQRRRHYSAQCGNAFNRCTRSNLCTYEVERLAKPTEK